MKKLLMAVVVLLGACSSSEPDDVVIIGDSITFLSTSALEDLLSESYDPDVSSTFGITIGESISVAERYADQDPEVVVINLGTNDAGRTDFNEAAANYETILGMFDGCKVVVNLAEAHKLGFEVTPERSQFLESFNVWLTELDGVVVVDWNQAVQEHPEWLPDGVHPVATKEYAELVAIGVEAC